MTQFPTPHARRLSYAFLMLPALLVGCGGTDFGPIGSVSGKLTMAGNALPEGTKVIFMDSTKGYAGFAFTDASGAYEIEWRREGKTYAGMPVGEYQVMLVPADAADVDELSADEMLDGGPETPSKSRIPHRYYRTGTSGLAYTINEGENVIDIDIPKK